jgi:glucokinase
MLLAGDVGGTKTNLAAYSSREELREPLAMATFPSADHLSLESLVQEFTRQFPQPFTLACFGVAGPVVDDRAEITNLPWTISARRLEQELGIPTVRLMNDLAAIASAIPLLQADDLHIVNPGIKRPNATLCVLAPGTGLGEAFLTWNGSRYVAHESEGGHADFGPSTPRQTDLLRYLQQRFGHVSCERVCSGIGLPNIYTFLKEEGFAAEPAWLAALLAGEDVDPTPPIVNAALNPSAGDELCVETLRMFVTIMGSEAGNLALKVLATGGVYLGGGIPPRILPALRDGTFMESFRSKGRLRDVLIDVPVYVITNPRVALVGAAAFGFD